MYNKELTESDIDKMIEKFEKNRPKRENELWIFSTTEQVEEELKKIDELMKEKSEKKQEFIEVYERAIKLGWIKKIKL